MSEYTDKMTKAIEATEREFSKIRAGQASPAILNDVRIDYYGTPTPISQVAKISVPEPRMLLVSPWEKTMVDHTQTIPVPKTENETQKFNKSGIVKESFNHILYQNKNWTEKKKYPVIEIEKEHPLTPFKAFKTSEKIKNKKKVKKIQILPKNKEISPNFKKKRDIGKKKKKIFIKICDYDENDVNEYDNKKFFKGISVTKNKNVTEEKIFKKIIKREELFVRENKKKVSSVNKNKRYRKIPIKIFFD